MKLKPCSIGLGQSLGVTVYCSLVASFFRYIGQTSVQPDGIAGVTLMLFLMVFSAAVTGLLVFGYPAYLALHNKIKEALLILAFTLLYSLLIFIIILFLVMI